MRDRYIETLRQINNQENDLFLCFSVRLFASWLGRGRGGGAMGAWRRCVWRWSRGCDVCYELIMNVHALIRGKSVNDSPNVMERY